MSRTLYPKDFINETLIGKIGKIIDVDAYLSFLLICSGIEFLGKCIDSTKEWESGSSKEQFKVAIIRLFPDTYHNIVNELYEDLRCGLVHRVTPGKIKLTQNSGDHSGKISYLNHPFNDGASTILLVEYFYFDFVEACKKVIRKDFEENKMNKPILYID